MDVGDDVVGPRGATRDPRRARGEARLDGGAQSARPDGGRGHERDGVLAGRVAVRSPLAYGLYAPRTRTDLGRGLHFALAGVGPGRGGVEGEMHPMHFFFLRRRSR